jgi:hypothetical protein
MQLPFTITDFLNVFKNYNEAVFPIQIIFYVIAFICIYLLFAKKEKSGAFISTVLAFFWLWIGIIYHIIFFSSINKAAYFFGTLFIIQGILFFYLGLIKKSLSFNYQRSVNNIIGFIFILYALIIYPLLGILFGHHYPSTPTFGLPCPTTIFTFGILLFINKKISVLVLLIPLVWSIIGFGAALNLSIYQDYGLLIAGLTGFILLLFVNKKNSLK